MADGQALFAQEMLGGQIGIGLGLGRGAVIDHLPDRALPSGTDKYSARPAAQRCTRRLTSQVRRFNGRLPGRTGTPAVTQFLLHMRGRQAMPVGHVLPVPGQVFAEGQQVRLLQLLDAFQHLAFGVGGFQRHVEVMQQVAEQGAIEQAKGFARVGLPEAFGAGGDVGGQGFAVEVQAERLLR